MGPLDGLRVLDCSTDVAGSRMAGFLADYGADVVWVEPPGGHPVRAQMPAAASVYNRGKRSIVLDLSDETQRGQLVGLAAGVDVVIEDWAPEVAAELGVDWPSLRAVNPRVVLCSISGFGEDGPNLPVKGYEAMVHALFGTMDFQSGHRDGPIFSGLPFAGIGAAYMGLIGTLAALYRRNVDGFGRHVETSLLDGLLAYMSILWWDCDAIPAVNRRRTGGSDGTRIVARTFRCSDDKYVGIHTGGVGAFGRLMTLLGLDDRIPPGDGGRDMGTPLSPEQAQIIVNEIPGLFLQHSREWWVDKLLETDVAVAEIYDPTECFDSPQVAHNEMVVEVDDPVLGRVQQVAPAAKFTATPAAVPGPAPTPGQHTTEVLAELARAGEGRVPRPTGDPDTRPLLDGVNIVDGGAYFAGPYTSRLLADLGANVIKLEPPRGDEMRGLNMCFYAAQAGKRSLAANLKDEALHEAMVRLLAWADVVHHNMRPGAAERLGMGVDDHRAQRPDGIYLHSPGWGSSGPFKFRQSFEPLQSAYCGVQIEVAGQFNLPLPPAASADPGNGLLGAVSVLMALLHRQTTGEGNAIEAPQLNATMAHLAHVVRRPDGEVIGAGRLDPLQLGFSALERLYATADGWVCLAAFDDEEIGALGRTLGLEILGDDRFSTWSAREEHDYELATLIAGELEGRKTDEILEELTTAGVSAVEPESFDGVPSFFFDLDFRRTGRMDELAHPVKGMVREIAQTVRCTDARVVPHRLAPEIGEHSDEILAELCGYAPDAIAELHARGVVAGPSTGGAG